EEELHLAYVPGLEILVFATRAPLLSERVTEHFKLLLASRAAKNNLQFFAEVERIRELKLSNLEVRANLKTAKQIEAESEASEKKESVLEKMAEELPPFLSGKEK